MWDSAGSGAIEGPDARYVACHGLFESHLDAKATADIRLAISSNYVLGNSRFQEQIAATFNRRVTHGLLG